MYLRLSDEDHNKLTKEQLSESIKNQEMMLKEYALNEGFRIVGIYNDEDYSGGDSTRPEFNKMIKECENRNVDVVLCKTQARFARDSELIEKYLHNKFHEWNVRFQTVVDRIDNTKRETKKTSQILGLTDEWYLEDTSLNIRETLKTKRKAGKCTASFVKYGYIKDPENRNHLIPDPITKSVVKNIFDYYVKGDGLETIAKKLNNEKIPSPLEYKKMNGSKLHIPLIKDCFEFDCIEKTGTYIIDISFCNNETQILNNLITFNYLTTDMKFFNNKCDITLKRYSSNKTKIYYSEKNNLDINNFNEKDFILLHIDELLPKTVTCIATKTNTLDRTHITDYQFEITLKENIKHDIFYFIIKKHVDNIDIDLNYQTSIRKKLKWCSQTIKGILKDEVYIGNMIQFKSTTVSYKNHTVVHNSDKDRIRKNNTHECIVDKPIWYAVQERLEEKSRSNKSGVIHAFANKIYCMKCGKRFSKCGKKLDSGYSYLCCKDKGEKWSNCDNKKYIREEDLHNLVLEKINMLLDKFLAFTKLEELNNNMVEKDLFKDKLNILEKELNSLNKKLQNKNSYFQKLYEDRISGIIYEKEFLVLMNKYKDDISRLEDRIKIVKKDIFSINSKKNIVENKKNTFKKYSHINKLSIEIVNTFIDKVLIGTYNNKKNTRNIKIIWNLTI